MKRVINLCVFLLCLSMATACDGSQKKEKKKTTIESMMEGDFRGVVGKGKELGKLTMVVAQNIEIEDKRVKFDMSRSEFKKTGLDTDYYKKVKESVKEFNAWLDTNPTERAEDTAKDFMKFLAKKFEEWSE